MGSSSKPIIIMEDSDATPTATLSDGGATTETESDTKEAAVVDSIPFSVGEKVLAFHSNCLYEAKVQKIKYEMGRYGFLIHYLGWKKSWDEWVGDDCLLKLTEENIQTQEKLTAKHGGEKIAKPGRGSGIRHMNSSVAIGKKRKNNSTAKEDNKKRQEKTVHFHIPSTLKKQLVDDYEFIREMGKLVKLPREPNVDDILAKYSTYISKNDSKSADSVAEILSGLRSYFDIALPVRLLYNSERQQYQEATKDGTPPASLYGAEHLLRLFVKLPELLSAANIDEDTLKELQQELQDILGFIESNQSDFFVPSYEKPEDVETSQEID